MQSLLNEAARHVAQWEGFSSHIYLDSVGVPTCAYGYNLSFEDHKNKVSVVAGWPKVDIDSDIAACKRYASKFGHHNILASAYEPRTALRIEKANGHKLLASTLEKFVDQLNDLALMAMPIPAALAVVDMAYNLGASGLRRKFPRFLAHVRNRDWMSASEECKRRGISAERNTATMKMLIEASAA